MTRPQIGAALTLVCVIAFLGSDLVRTWVRHPYLMARCIVWVGYDNASCQSLAQRGLEP